MHFLLIYDLSPDYLERRGEFRNEHLKLGWEAQERGEIVVAGALADPADLVCCCSPATRRKPPSASPGPIRTSSTAS